MRKFFNKNQIARALGLLFLNAVSSSLTANECCYPCVCNRFYIGAFGGGLYSNSTPITQTGTAFFAEELGGPLAIDARGDSGRNSAGFGGIQVGYEWLDSPWYIGLSDCGFTPGVEFEAYWYNHTKRAELDNPTPRLLSHVFADSFPMSVGVYLFNGVLTLNNSWFGRFSPYVGGGIGVARISIRNAESIQIAPPEAGVDHFNSDQDDSSFTFAAQAKAGLRYNITPRLHIFGEYRFLYLDSSRYVFGSTMYPDHAPTSTWIVDIKNICYNGFAVGLQFDL